MKLCTSLAILSASIFIYSANAAADDTQHKVNLTATVPVSCSLGQPSFANELGLGFQSATEAESTFEVDIVNGKAAETEGMINFPQFHCNSKVHVSMSPSRSLKNNTVLANESGGLAREIPYRVTFISGSTMPEPDMGFPTDIYLFPSLSVIPLSLTIRVEPNGPTLAAGTYTDTLTVSFSPEI
ncbi:MAG TPA: spore coat protein U domain-containing protein [Hyphomicrobiales bacterium]|jgi:hypothetical protein